MQRIKKICLSLVAALIILAIYSISALAVVQFPLNKAYYFKDSQRIDMDARTRVKDGRTLVPVRYLADALGIKNITWDKTTQGVTLSNGYTTATFFVGAKGFVLNGKAMVSDVPPQLLEDRRTYLPARVLAESFGYTVTWDNETQMLTFSSNRRELSTREIVQLIQPATVLIETQRGQGSGFFVSKEGDIVTNAHVVRGAKSIKVTTIDGRQYMAGIKKINNHTDLAILTVIGNNLLFPFIEKTRYIDSVSIGDEITVFGNPLGLSGTVTKGIVSAKRELPTHDAFKQSPIKVIQYDATVDKGSSGGAVINSYGELMGITFAGYSSKDFNFAIPADYYYWLNQSNELYGLKDDWYCYLVEENGWLAKSSSIMNNTFQPSNPNDWIYELQFNKIPSIENLKKDIENYYASYPEIQNLRDLLLEVVRIQQITYVTTLDMFKNPLNYYNASRQVLDSLSNSYKTALDKYNMERTLIEQKIK
ncbi:trypsin-like serine protease [Thermanaerosceptrum fracticalcis]|uniref:Trypsin-like serine protease n=1 Tax=Thermanaerosceptrum fracticalcis TaxID=1712410 RepID=A0A7G6E183_THEFR|nr:stalk domain-containing protein [Thermanaerosceptrum fracticalcis]QNB45837.1 trypsin-like serine protease [Thermanaerosceptrum fracticalcis]